MTLITRHYYLMRFLARVFSLLFFLTLNSILYSLTAQDVRAEGEFASDYHITYQVDLDGRTTANQNITLKNKTANFYADRFELKIGSTKVDNVRASDIVGPMETDVKFDNNVTSISVKFNQRVIGLDKTQDFTLTYASNELASKAGQIWEISIPRIANSQDITSYNVTVNVPVIFGPLAFAIPSPQSADKRGTVWEFTFDKSQLIETGIAMSFGTKQVFTFTLNYFLENKNLTTQVQEIALPPDNNYQKVVFEAIEPEPGDTIVDEDGNYLARFKLAPKQELDIKVTGAIEVTSTPARNITKSLTPAKKEQYLSPQRYWETDNGAIQQKATELKNAQNIYRFVSDFLSYNQKRLEQSTIIRKGAASAIADSDDAVCTEFTDLFIAIARAAGIPAREVEGFAYTQNERLRPLSLTSYTGDLLHAWPEYWDQERGWVQIDPTWGSTSGGLDYFNKLDFNHITFVQRGASSTSPYPAGAYKRSDESDKKTVFISFAQELPQSISRPELSLNVPDKIIAGIPIKITSSIKNVGTVSIFDGQLELNHANLKNLTATQHAIGILPPYAQRQFLYRIQSPNLLKASSTILTLSFADVSVSKTISIIPIYYLLFSTNFVFSVFVAIFIILIGFFLYKKYHHPKIKITSK